MGEPRSRDFAKSYRSMSESELMDLAREFENLTPPAQEALKQEFRDRSLEPPLLDDEDDIVEPSATASVVTIRRYRDLSEALVARAVLEGESIRCLLQDENMVRLQWSISNFLGGIRLQVSSRDALEAERVLTAPQAASFELDSGPAFVQPVCPQCGSLDIVADDKGRRIALASTIAPALPILVGVPALLLQPEGVWKCLNCGCRWQDDTDEAADTDGGAPVD